MRAGPGLRRAGRAAALLGTAAALLATSRSPDAAYAVASSCGPSGEILLSPPAGGCGGSGDPSWSVAGAASVGLPAYAEREPGAPRSWVLAGAVMLPGTQPPLSVHRVCTMGPEIDGVRPLRCTGQAPEAACEGTLTVPRSTP